MVVEDGLATERPGRDATAEARSRDRAVAFVDLVLEESKISAMVWWPLDCRLIGSELVL